MYKSTSFISCKDLELNVSNNVLCFFREEERENREAELRREMEESDKQHREMIERLQIQVRLHFSQSYLDLLQ